MVISLIHVERPLFYDSKGCRQMKRGENEKRSLSKVESDEGREGFLYAFSTEGDYGSIVGAYCILQI